MTPRSSEQRGNESVCFQELWSTPVPVGQLNMAFPVMQVLVIPETGLTAARAYGRQ